MKHIIIAFLFISLLSACKYDGTDTGNPDFANSPPATDCNGKSRCLAHPYIKTQVGIICEKVQNCFSIDSNHCYQAVMNQEGLAQEISIQVNSFKELDNLYTEKKIHVDSNLYEVCVTAIKNLSCDANIVQNSISVGENVDFEHVHLLLQAESACKDVYSLIQ